MTPHCQRQTPNSKRAETRSARHVNSKRLQARATRISRSFRLQPEFPAAISLSLRLQPEFFRRRQFVASGFSRNSYRHQL